jgi:hypothetical protein
MRPPNYHQARKSREQSRKLRQSEKLQRRTARVKQDESPAPADVPTATDAATEPGKSHS